MFYLWINSLVNEMVAELESELEKKFIRDERMMEGATRHSEAMVRQGYHHAPKNLIWPAEEELVRMRFANYRNWPPYQEGEVEKAIREMVSECIFLRGRHYHFLVFYPVIGVGVALKKDDLPKKVAVYTTIRLRAH